MTNTGIDDMSENSKIEWADQTFNPREANDRKAEPQRLAA